MINISIKTKSKDEDGWIFNVIVRQEDSETQHEVRLSKIYYKQLTNENLPPDILVKHSFEFLLQREVKESILKSFNIGQIKDYFPEYEQQIIK